MARCCIIQRYITQYYISANLSIQLLPTVLNPSVSFIDYATLWHSQRVNDAIAYWIVSSFKSISYYATHKYGTLCLNDIKKHHFYTKLNKASFNMLDPYDHTKIATTSQRAVHTLLLQHLADNLDGLFHCSYQCQLVDSVFLAQSIFTRA